MAGTSRTTLQSTGRSSDAPMSDVVYKAEIPLTRVKGPLRLAYMPAEQDPVRFGTHGPIARHYGIQGDVPEPHATTIDYVIAATGG